MKCTQTPIRVHDIAICSAAPEVDLESGSTVRKQQDLSAAGDRNLAGDRLTVTPSGYRQCQAYSRVWDMPLLPLNVMNMA